MSVISKKLHSDAESFDCDRSHHLLERFHKNQRGTTLTELLITLPIFILIFVSMVRLGQFELTAGKLWKNAYQETWAKALPVSQQQVVPIDSLHTHASPSQGGSTANEQLGQHSAHNKNQGIENTIGGLERGTYSGLQRSGHWGESFERVQPVAEYVGLRRVDSLVTSQPTTIVGNSGYARSLVDDSGGMVKAPNGGSSVAAAVGAGIRYGTVAGVGEIKPVIMGVNIPMYVHFNTLVAPMPFTDSTTTMEVTRNLLLKQPHYRNILGISMSQPLSSGTGSLNVNELAWDD